MKSHKVNDANSFGKRLAGLRKSRLLTQAELAALARINRNVLIRFEQDESSPSLEQLQRLAAVLEVPLQAFLTASFRPGEELEDIAIELRSLGIVDLFVSGARAPGAFRPREELLAIVLNEDEPEPRIVEAIPAALAWNSCDARLLQAYGRGRGKRTLYRLGWLADVALTIDKHLGFPGGCANRKELARFLRLVRPPAKAERRRAPDSLGSPALDQALSPVWKRWHINYAANLQTFRERAQHLHAQGGAKGYSLPGG